MFTDWIVEIYPANSRANKPFLKRRRKVTGKFSIKITDTWGKGMSDEESN